jgi:hypothetical protein
MARSCLTLRCSNSTRLVATGDKTSVFKLEWSLTKHPVGTTTSAGGASPLSKPHSIPPALPPPDVPGATSRSPAGRLWSATRPLSGGAGPPCRRTRVTPRACAAACGTLAGMVRRGAPSRAVCGVTPGAGLTRAFQLPSCSASAAFLVCAWFLLRMRAGGRSAVLPL